MTASMHPEAALPIDPKPPRQKLQLSYWNMSSYSKRNRRWYFFFEITILCAGAIVAATGVLPILLGKQAAEVAVPLLGVAIAVSQGLKRIFKFHDNWIMYRATASALEKEMNLYDSSCPPYDNGDRDKRLAVRLTEALDDLHVKWSQIMAEALAEGQQPKPASGGK
ncbi:MAG: hypothetical protein HONBIEJF_00921 [Fimbriimonadaceae bacterium]|nr:hypothetical protein [Fimbriimonadaceae bacterium]